MELILFSKILALMIFFISYFFIITEFLPHYCTVWIGGILMVFFKILNPHQFMESIDLDVIFLLVGMMIIVDIISETGIFEWISIKVVKLTNGDIVKMTIALCIITAFFSAFLDNVTTILIIAPITILLSKQLNISPEILIIFEVFSSNIGGLATIMGEPTNPMIAFKGNLSFNEFIINLGPVVIINMIVLIFFIWITLRNSNKISRLKKAKIFALDASKSLKNKKLLIKSSIVFSFMMMGFILKPIHNVEPGIIAMLGAVFLIIISKKNEEVLKNIEWSTIFFFMGLFTIVGGLKEAGILTYLSEQILKITNNNLKILSLSMMWISSILSSIFDNIPYTATVVPIVSEIIPKLTNLYPTILKLKISYALWWPLTIGVCLGGNGTILGASANMVAASILKKSGYPISFKYFFYYGFPIMIITNISSTIYIIFRYLKF